MQWLIAMMLLMVLLMLHTTSAAATAAAEGTDAYRSRCWKAGYSPQSGRPVDHTPKPFVIAPACRGHIYLVTVVHSGIMNRHKRDLIRNTWASVVNVDGRRLATVFVLGLSVNATENRAVASESDAFGDLVVADFVDHYRNLTYKNLYGIRWAMEHCQGASFVFKADDDVLLNVYHLMSYVADRLAGARNFFFCSTARDNRINNRGLKWFVSPEEWRDEAYPIHCKGLGYLFSTDLLPALHHCAKWRHYFWIDDIFVTGALSQALGAAMLHWPPGWDFQYLHPRHMGQEVGQALLYNELSSSPQDLLTRRTWKAILAQGI